MSQSPLATALTLIGVLFLLPAIAAALWFGFPVAMYFLTNGGIYRLPVVVPLTQDLLAIVGVCLAIGVGLITMAGKLHRED